MQKNLVIVESPAKAKTIEKFLGKEYHVMSSFGHIRDLKDKEFGIDVNDNYKPTYVIPSDKKKLVDELKKEADKADTVWLASDEDREGEAIAWHLSEVLELEKKQTHRIVFHEITKDAILKAIETPRSIDMNVVDAQQARRVLDRIVGFELSPVLWRKVKPSLSAGRVQSVTVRLVVERERERNEFKTETTFKITANFVLEAGLGDTTVFQAELKKRFATENEAEQFLKNCIESEFRIENIERKPVKRTPPPPFTTSTLQQEASRKFGFPVATTMRVAQSLYESGKITYMRTDSVHLSELALSTAKAEIISVVGEKYHKRRQYSTKSKGAQEAHEAIRPTYMNVHEVEGTAQERRLYDLIWKRTIATQMADAEIEKTVVTININNQPEKFIATGEVLKFDGFLNVYMESTDDEIGEDHVSLLPDMQIDDRLTLQQMQAQQRYSQKPPRYTEASLVRKLEELGIGRPSTYAPTISTIQNRGYVEKREITNEAKKFVLITLENGTITKETKQEKPTVEKGKLSPTDIGMVVNDYLTANFPSIMDYNFTANIEHEFDKIAEGKVEWTKDIDMFYKQFHPNVQEAMTSTGRKAGERELGTDPQTGKPVFVKIGRFGPVAQIGTVSDEDKPRFAPLRIGQSIESLTLDEALDLFKLPMNLGEFENESLSVGIGKFGPYVRHGKAYVSIPKGEDPLSVTYERAVQLIEDKRVADKNKEIKSFCSEDIKILNGRFGAYIYHAGKNYKLPKNAIAEELSVEDCKKIISETADKPTKKTTKTTKTAKTTKSPVKKAAK